MFPNIFAAFQAVLVTSMQSEFGVRRRKLASALELCESPIEARFLLGLMSAAALRDLNFVITDDDGEQLYIAEIGKDDPTILYCTPQKQIGQYRVDFALTEVGENVDHAIAHLLQKPVPYGSTITRRRLAVECDGHYFHERTKEQATRDKQRDRFLFNAEYPVMRFTGSEIMAGSLHCAQSIMEWVLGPDLSDDGT